MSGNPNRYVHSLYNDAFYLSMVFTKYNISIHRNVHFTNLCHYISGWGHVTGMQMRKYFDFSTRIKRCLI